MRLPAQLVIRNALQGFAGDLATADAAAHLVAHFPAVDILVNNLGIFEPKPFEEIPDEDWRRFFDVNVLSGIRLSRAHLLGMKVAQLGRIVFISGESAIQIPRVATTDEVASLVGYVCSPVASATNGAALRGDGGLSERVLSR